MIIWINGAFGSGKTTAAFELHRRLKDSFVYDPENVGYFIRRNATASFQKGDFQDIRLWRETNYEMLKMIEGDHDGVIIVPMTIVNLQYYDEIITRLRNDGIEVKHYILYASQETLKKRLRKRLSSVMKQGDTFAYNSIDRCIHAFDHDITEVKIMTDNKSVDEVVQEIARKAQLTLMKDNRNRLLKLIDRYWILFKHIR